MNKFENIGIYLKQIHQTASLSEEERTQCFKDLKKKGPDSETARLKIIQDNLGLVVNLAKKYYYPGMNIEFIDFIEEGNIGLVKAVEKFDYSKGFKFSTYASWWIEKYFQEAVLKNRSIVQIPEKTLRYLKKIEETTNQLLQNTGKAPDIESVSKKIDMSITELRQTIQSAMRMKNVRSLDYYIDGDKTRRLEDVIASEQFQEEELTERLSKQEEVERVLSVLTPEEQFVIKSRFALIDDSKATYKEIAKKFGISPSKAKEIQERAIKKLKRMYLQDII